MNRSGISLGSVVYLIIGLIVAANRGYLAAGIHTVGEILTIILVIILWPLVLLGVNLAVTF